MTLAPIDEHARSMADQRRLLRLRTDHDAGRVAEEQQRDVEGVAELHEARGLVGRRRCRSRRPDAAGLLATTPIGRPSMRINAVIMPWPKPRRISSNEPSSASVSINLAHVVDAQTVLAARHGAAGAGRDRSSPSAVPGNRTRYFLATSTASASSSTAMSTTPFGTCTRHRPDFLGREDAEPAAFDHRRAAHADGRVRGRDDRRRSSRAARRCPRSSGPRSMPTSGTEPAQAGEAMEGVELQRSRR